jgi:hypothetical protein
MHEPDWDMGVAHEAQGLSDVDLGYAPQFQGPAF